MWQLRRHPQIVPYVPTVDRVDVACIGTRWAIRTRDGWQRTCRRDTYCALRLTMDRREAIVRMWRLRQQPQPTPWLPADLEYDVLTHGPLTITNYTPKQLLKMGLSMTADGDFYIEREQRTISAGRCGRP